MSHETKFYYESSGKVRQMGCLVSSCITSLLPSKISVLEIVPSYIFISVVTKIYSYISDSELEPQMRGNMRYLSLWIYVTSFSMFFLVPSIYVQIL